MKAFTIQMGRRWECTKRDIRVIDTTVMTSKDRLFSPTWAIVRMVKEAKAEFAAGRIGQAELDEAKANYTREYRRILIDSWVKNRPQWEELLRSEDWAAFACFCKAGDFCHRLLLIDFLKELTDKLQIPFEYEGELT